MKIPYIKLYTADLLAASRNVTSEQLGDAILAACELAFENDTAYQPETTREKTLFTLLMQWKDESKTAWKQNKKAAQQAARTRWKKHTLSDGASRIPAPDATAQCHTETDTETKTETDTDTETETKNLSLSLRAHAQGGERERDFSKKNSLSTQFADQVIARFESAVKTPEQRRVFIKNNAHYFQDILAFCEHSIPLALQTISACVDRLHQGGVTGGYGAVCRNLPEYYEKAKAQLAEQSCEKNNS